MIFEGASGFLHVDREEQRFHQSEWPGQKKKTNFDTRGLIWLAIEPLRLKSLTQVPSVAVANKENGRKKERKNLNRK